MKGIIIRVSVKNFITYNSAEFHPGRNLNLIIGPNGTGKSSLVCAIVLGLGGKPKVVARGSNIGSYVKEGQSESNIEIELYNPDGPNYVVTRNIVASSNKSTWGLNGHPATQKQVEDVISELNIQVDNLCQFLPQDRVQDFAKMDQKSLLENTEKTVGSAAMYEQHLKLKELRRKQQDMEKGIDDIAAQLEKEQQMNDRIAVEATNIYERKTLLEEIALLNQKRAWVTYNKMKVATDDLKRDMDLALRSVEKHKKKSAPHEENLSKVKTNIQEIQKDFQRKNNDCTKRKDILRNRKEKVEKVYVKLGEITDAYQDKLVQHEKREEDIRNSEQYINNLRMDLDTDKETDIRRKEEIKNLTRALSKHGENINRERVKVMNTNTDITNRNAEIIAKENELRRAYDVIDQRLQMLRRRANDVYQAVMWLRENQHQFQMKVWEPMVLEISVIDDKFAKYVEAIIPHRDLFAFTCESKVDMNKLLNIARKTLRLKISAVHSGSEHPPCSSYRPKEPIERLQQYGLYTFVREVIKGPEPIMKYLCRQCKIDSIPIGDQSTFDKSNLLPQHIRCFFTEHHIFNVSFSKYSKQKATKSSEVSRTSYLSNSINTDILKVLKTEIKTLNESKAALIVKLKAFEEIMKRENILINDIRAKKKELTEKSEHQHNIQTHINIKLTALKLLMENSCDIEQLTQQYNKEYKMTVLQICNYQGEILQLTKEYFSSVWECQIQRGEGHRLRNHAVQLENELQEMKSQQHAAEVMYQNLRSRFDDAKQQLKDYYTCAKQLTDGVGPSNKEKFKDFEIAFQQLPDTVEMIENMLQSKQAKVGCISEGSEELLREYEERKKTICDLTDRIASGHVETDVTQRQLEQIKREWLPPLQDLIAKINERFGHSFQQMGCVGEVSLSTGENENDFHQYGLCIKVKFRDSDQLQQLNHFVQSGGERAVATAIYMISLQELTSVPFRCVDEINQGMDPVNERMVFDLLVKTTSQQDTAQYFLLTPKLLPSLQYEKTMNILCVYNGPLWLEQSQWNMKRFKKIKRNLKNQQNGH